MNEIYPRYWRRTCWFSAQPVYFDMLSRLAEEFHGQNLRRLAETERQTVAGVAVAEEGIGQAVSESSILCWHLQYAVVGSVTGLAKAPGRSPKIKNVTRRC